MNRGKLTGVSATLWTPLRARARAVGWHPAFRDELAEKMVAELEAEASPTKVKRELRQRGPRRPERPSLVAANLSQDIAAVVRADAIDAFAREFFAESASGLLVNLGAGLCTRFHRLDNGRLHGLDIDLPEVIEMKRGLIKETSRYRLMSCSVTDPRWVETAAATAAKLGTQDVFLAAEGVLHYLAPADVRAFFAMVADRLPGARLAFDYYAPWLPKLGLGARVGREKVKLRWGLGSARLLAKIDPRIQVLEELALVEHCGRYLSRYRWASRFPLLKKSYNIAYVEIG
jgi:O-methyltransferase involved in polyketide biosynthesis